MARLPACFYATIQGRAANQRRQETFRFATWGYGVFGRALSKEDQKKLNRAIRRQARPLAENRRELRRQTQLLVEALRAEPFDPERVREIADQMQTQVLERQRIAQDLLLAHIENMTPREREAYARRLERKLRPKDDRQR